MKEEKALEVMKEMLKSEEMFVADYARESIGLIEGKKLEFRTVNKKLEDDLSLMPKDTGGVGGLVLSGGEAVDVVGMAKSISQFLGGDDEGDEMIRKMQKGLIDFVNISGNVRIDSLVAGVPVALGEDEGWLLISVRGEYDRKSVLKAIKKMGGLFEMEEKDGMMLLKPENDIVFGLVSDEQLVFMGGPNGDELPFDDVAERLKSGDKGLRFGEKLKALVGQTEKNGAIWASTLITDNMKRSELLKDLDTLQLESEWKNRALELLLIGNGQDAEKVQKTLSKAEMKYQGFIKEEVEKFRLGMGEEGKELVNFITGLEFRGRGVTGIVRGKLENVDPVKIYSSFMNLMMRNMNEFEEEHDPFEER